MDRFLTVAIGVVTLVAALVTYAAVRIESEASGADSRAASETLVLQSRELFAETQASTFQGYVNQYRVTNAEADALKGVPGRSQLVRDAGSYFSLQSGLSGYLRSSGVATEFDRQALHESALHFADERTIPRGQPELTASKAMALHERARTLMQILVGFLVVVVFLTCARVVSVAPTRRLLTAVAALSFLGLCVASALQIWLPGTLS